MKIIDKMPNVSKEILKTLKVGETFYYKGDFYLIGENDNNLFFINLYTGFVFSEDTLPFCTEIYVIKTHAKLIMTY